MKHILRSVLIVFVGRALVLQPVPAQANGRDTELQEKIQRTFHVPNPLPIPDAQKHGNFEGEPGIVADRVTYTTQLGMLVPAIVYHPADTSVKRPAIIIVNGHG